MTMSERHEMWRKMRAAKNVDEKMELWAAKYVELEKRAGERGVRLVEMEPMMNGGHHGTQERESRWGGEHRMMSMGHSSPHPPMGR
ncbi:hypothetical protein CCP1ISM_2340001 [Azospirillaceae bacterium]